MTAGGRVVKAMRLAGLLTRRPAEFLDRVEGLLEARLDPGMRHPEGEVPVEWHAALDAAGAVLGARLASEALRAELAAIERELSGRLDPRPRGGIPPVFDAGSRLASTAYFVTRVLRPAVVVETGVAYGVTSAYILAALAANGRGVLHSVDLPLLGADERDTGAAVRDEHRPRWRYHRGGSRRLLPRVLAGVAPVGLFVHDSLHTSRTMRYEFDIVAPRLDRPAVVLADDIDGNDAFHTWSVRSGCGYAARIVEPEKRGHFGLAVFGPR